MGLMQSAPMLSESSRWELYRVLGEPVRLQLLALSAEEELTIGELASLVGESQPNVSRHVAALRQAGLVQVRSGSRIGYSDLGKNRARVEELRAVLAGLRLP